MVAAILEAVGSSPPSRIAPSSLWLLQSRISGTLQSDCHKWLSPPNFSSYQLHGLCRFSHFETTFLTYASSISKLVGLVFNPVTWRSPQQWKCQFWLHFSYSDCARLVEGINDQGSSPREKILRALPTYAAVNVELALDYVDCGQVNSTAELCLVLLGFLSMIYKEVKRGLAAQTL
jgi:hypothetical protein